jgi:hypothetical protein
MFHSIRYVAATAALLAVVLPTLHAQNAAPEAPSRVELAGAYHYLDVNGSISGYPYKNMPAGALVDLDYYLNPHLGLQVEGDITGGGANDCLSSVEAGPIWRFRRRSRLTTSLHGDAGAARLGGPLFQQCTWGLGLTTGGSVDYRLPLPKINNRISWRIVQADYEYVHVDFGALKNLGLIGGTADVNAFRIGTGIVLRLR